jgi:hypothetical protein
MAPEIITGIILAAWFIVVVVVHLARPLVDNERDWRVARRSVIFFGWTWPVVIPSILILAVADWVMKELE